MSKIVLMTGSSSGIGLATAKRLAHDPDHRFVIIATVIAMSETDDLVAAVGEKLDKTVFIKKLDVSRDEDISDAVGEVIKTHGRIDILLNIAGIALFGIPERISRRQIDLAFNVNTIGPIRLAQAVLPGMKKSRAGKIVTVSSDLGKIGWSNADVYCATKFAVEGFFESLAAAARSFNIRVCLIEPGAVSSAFMGNMIQTLEAQAVDDSVDDIDRRHLSFCASLMKEGKTATSDDIAEAIVTRCLDVDEPVFRHLISDDQEAIAKAVSDLSGEAAVATGRMLIGAS